MTTPDVRVRLSAEGVAEVVAALKQVQGESQKTQQKQGKGFGGLNAVLGSTTKLLGAVGAGFSALAAVHFGRQAISELKAWESSWAEVKTIMAGTRGEAEVLSRRVRELASIIPKDQSLLARGFYQALSSGINDTGQALAFTRTAAKAATGGLTDVFTAVDVGTTILNAYGLSVEQAGRIFDVLFTTVREGKVEFADLAQSIGTAIPAYAQAKIPIEQLSAAIATLSKGGMNAEIATTGLRSMLMQVIKPADESIAIARDLGIAFNVEALAAKGLVPWLKEVHDKTQGNSTALAKLFPDVRGLTAVLALSGKQWEEFARIMDVTANQSMGASQEAFDRINETAAAQEQILKNRLKNAWIDLGQGILKQWGHVMAAVGTLLPETLDMQIEGLERTERQIAAIATKGQKLASVYQTVSRESDGSEAAQKRVRQAMLDLAAAFPEVIAQWDEYGNAIAVDTGLLNDHGAALKRVLAMEAQDTFLEQADRVKRLHEELATLSGQLNALASRAPTDLIPAEERLVVPVEFWGASAPAGSGPMQTVEQAREALLARLDALKSELTARSADMARILITSGLEAEVEAFESLAVAVDAGSRPASDLSDALEHLNPQLRVLLQTTDPAQMTARLRRLAALLEQAKAATTPSASDEGKQPTWEQQLATVRKAASFQAAQRDREIAALKQQAQQRLAAERMALKEGTKSVQESYAARRQIVEEAFRQELALLQQKLDLARQEKDAGKYASETARLEAEISSRRIEHENQLADLAAEERQATREAGEAVLDVERDILEAQGRRHEAALAEIDQLAQEYDRKLAARGDLGDVERQAAVEKYRDLLTLKAEFEELSKQSDRKMADVESGIENIQRKVEQGLITEAESHQAILDLTHARIPALRQLAETLARIAAVVGDPELAERAKELRDAIDGIASTSAAENVDRLTEATRNLGTDIKTAGLDALTDALAGIGEETENARQTFLAFAKDFLSAAKRIIAQWLALKMLGAFGMTFSEGGAAAGKASGGYISGPGTSTSDSIPAWLSAGEYVVRARQVERPGGLKFLRGYNAGQYDPLLIMQRFPAFSPGGRVSLISPRAFASGGLVTVDAGDRSAAASNGKMEVYLSDGLAARILESPAGERWFIKTAARNRRALNKLWRP